MALSTFLTIAEANSILGETLPWDDAEDSEKQDALELSRIYIESNYSIQFDEDDSIPEKVQIGSALIANEHLTKDIFTRQTGLGSLEEITVKAGSVATTKKYTNQISKTWIDPFMKATSIMKPYCLIKSGSGIRIKKLVRG